MRVFGLAGALVVGSAWVGTADGALVAARLQAPLGIVVATAPDRAVLEVGQASWYGAELAGNPTASGEPFDPNAMTAAHPALPFGTPVTVVNLENGEEVEVIVNDRGPFAENRVIDVSAAAADKLGFKDDGITQVRLEVAPAVLERVEASL